CETLDDWALRTVLGIVNGEMEATGPFLEPYKLSGDSIAQVTIASMLSHIKQSAPSAYSLIKQMATSRDEEESKNKEKHRVVWVRSGPVVSPNSQDRDQDQSQISQIFRTGTRTAVPVRSWSGLGPVPVLDRSLGYKYIIAKYC